MIGRQTPGGHLGKEFAADSAYFNTATRLPLCLKVRSLNSGSCERSKYSPDLRRSNIVLAPHRNHHVAFTAAVKLQRQFGVIEFA